MRASNLLYVFVRNMDGDLCLQTTFFFNIDPSEKIIDNLKTIKLFLQWYMYLFNGLSVTFWVEVISKSLFSGQTS